MIRCCYRLLAHVLLLSLAVGCGGNAPSKDEIDQGRKAVETFLASWKQGDTPGKLKGHSILVDDPDWTGGMKLLDFQITGTESDHPTNPRFRVKLKLKDEDGPQSEKDVVYETNARKDSGKVLVARDPFF
ncbi:MAG: hypothetical protein FJ271_23760 [Planctomycetes bacterium]|nr:hypothetical protein [Planctomycetota bacterium]